MEHAILLIAAVLLLIWGSAMVFGGIGMGMAAVTCFAGRDADVEQGCIILPGFIFGLLAGGLLIWAGVSVWP